MVLTYLHFRILKFPLNKCPKWVYPIKVVPQFGIAKLVQITPISLWFIIDISILFLWFINQLITGGHHLLWKVMENYSLVV